MYRYRIGKKCVKELKQNLFTAHGVKTVEHFCSDQITVDTDVDVLAVAFAGILQEQQVQQVDVCGVAMDTGSHFRYIAAHEISNNLGSGMSKALPVFHAFTGCDTVSCFFLSLPSDFRVAWCS